MRCNWPIRTKLLLCIALLLVMVATLAGSGSYGLYAYRGLVKSLSTRSLELPLAAELSRQVAKLQATLSGVRSSQELLPVSTTDIQGDGFARREEFRRTLDTIREALSRYREQLDANRHRAKSQFSDDLPERQTLGKIEQALAAIHSADRDEDWVLNEGKTIDLVAQVERLHDLTAELPTHMQQRLGALQDDVRLQYRSAIILTWVTTVAAVLTFLALLRLFYSWIFRPLRVLIAGSRQVAGGKFAHRIQLDTRDEMSELADAMNDMTDRFQAIRDDLDCQVRQRTKQVVQSEKLASVGFLAAGVAHEINNPLASIAICSESLDRRLADLLQTDDQQHEEVRTYLQMIQEEAFRCKEITEKLLDFSRMGDVKHQRTELRELVHGVIEMVRHMGRYQEKHFDLLTDEPVFAEVNAQEMKQVVLNLITNGLDSLEAGGRVTVEVRAVGDQAEMTFTDDGCGMTDDVLQHLFEPFFTRRRGGQGTGLGLSITYRIVADHNGQIEATSDGPGQGSRFVVTLPLCETTLRQSRQYQAA